MIDFLELMSIYILTLIVIVLSLSVLVIGVDLILEMVINPLLHFISEIIEPDFSSEQEIDYNVTDTL